ncbi:thioesterase family protein [Candidatus Sumerlaeota bacterium]|nr:thioesterase family protein [Candidatus Sumerlaeota bacterium]
MKETLVVGIEKETKYKVTKEMAPPHLPMPVISTPSMIGLIEGICLQCAQPHLDATETTVGTHVNVSHSGPAYNGEEVTIKARLKEINKRRLLFEVEVISPRATISAGTHERAVIDLTKFGGKKE